MESRTVYYLEGDGIGPEVSAAARPVLDEAVRSAYSGEKELTWQELLAGEKAYSATGSYLPRETLNALRDDAEVALKGPLTTPVGSGFRSLNVTLRQTFDLYACIRPVRYFKGIQTPVKRPQDVDIVVFRENTEDVYAGIEWEAGSPEAKGLIEFMRERYQTDVDPESAIGIKPITEQGSKRLVRRAIRFALQQKRPSVTLMHKGNIMKFTEGAFCSWGFELAREEFGDSCVSEDEARGEGEDRILIKDRIADNMFQQVLTRPSEYSVVATTNLNGDYISDALAAQVGGLGLAPGANVGDDLAVFEATHGSVPKRAGTNSANPSSLILSGALMLEHLGWFEASAKIYRALERTIQKGRVTYDLARLMQGAETVGCKEFAELIAENMDGN
ncbi:MAG: NADP-dependent isocitrate dehydrogenase [Desulfohalobiaceae bacterium]|nr:NADP-dependent isocitrate dehydrogenase [Desulfohalobiaceae bacterium]